MRFENVSVPEIYKTSADFRFFLKWFALALTRIKFDTENLIDLFDPMRCPEKLLWMLGDTIGFKYDDRLPASYNRLVMMYFMSMIRNRGSRDGITLAAEVNLAQYNILKYGEESDILNNRLEDTSIPINAVYVTHNVEQGYIDIVYFTTKSEPIDACLEYVRPLGMYLFQHSGARTDARTKISVDARLTNTNDIGISIGPTHVGHYRRADYARMQRSEDDPRHGVYYRNKKHEKVTDAEINPGERAMFSLQMSNNEHIVASLIDPIFALGRNPVDVTYHYPEPFIKSEQPEWNLRYDRDKEIEVDKGDVYTVEKDDPGTIVKPNPRVEKVMHQIGDAIALPNGSYTKRIEETDSPTVET